MYVHVMSLRTFEFLLCYVCAFFIYFFWTNLSYAWSILEQDANILDTKMADESRINSSEQVCASSGSVEEVPTGLSPPVHNTNQHDILKLLLTDSKQDITPESPDCIESESIDYNPQMSVKLANASLSEYAGDRKVRL